MSEASKQPETGPANKPAHKRVEDRIPVNITATIIQSDSMPIGCRISNLSSTGVMLRQDAGTSLLPIDLDNEVDLRLSLKQEDGRTVLELPITIVRESDGNLGGKFSVAQPDLMKLIEPYQTNGSNESQREKPSKTPNSKQKDAADLAAATAQNSNTSIAMWTAIVFLFGMLLYFHFDNESLRDELATVKAELGSIETPPTPVSDNTSIEKISDEIRSLRAAVIQAQTRYTDLEERMIIINQPSRVPSQYRASVPELKPEPESPATAPVSALVATDNWIVNLLSLANEEGAQAFASRLQEQGINAEVNVDSDNREAPLWRVQVGGFATREEAVTFSETTRQKLNLGSVWIYKEGGS